MKNILIEIVELHILSILKIFFSNDRLIRSHPARARTNSPAQKITMITELTLAVGDGYFAIVGDTQALDDS